MLMRTCLAVVVMVIGLTAAQAEGFTSADDAASEPVERVATLDFITTEIIALLGREPVAVAGLTDYRDWVGVANDAVADARDLGRRTEPDLEVLAASKPDLITGATFRHKPLLAGLRRIAPVVLYDWQPKDATTNALDHLRRRVRHLGGRLNRSNEAAAILADMDQALAKQAERLAKAGRADTPVILAQHVQGTDRFNIYTNQSLAAAIARAVGLQPVWDRNPEKFGFTTMRLRSLLELDRGHLLLVAEPDDRAFQQLRESTLWHSVPAVASGRIHRLPPRTWFFGGPRSVSRLARQFTDALRDH